MSTQLITLDSDSDDNEIVLASNLTRTQPLPTPEPNEHDDFIMRHEQITKQINKSKRKNKSIENDDDDDDIFSQQTNYAPYEPLLQTNDDITNKQYMSINSKQSPLHKDKYSTADKINILNQLQKSFSKTNNNNNNNNPLSQTINIVSSDTNSSQNTINIDAPDLFANKTNPIIINDDDELIEINQEIPLENDNDNDNPYLFDMDTNNAMKMIIDDEPNINAQIQREITEKQRKKQAIQKEKERLKQMEEEDRKFIQSFKKNKPKNMQRNNPKTRDNKKEKGRRQFESDNVFSAFFDKSFKSTNKNKNTRKRRRDIEHNDLNANRRKRHKSHSIPSYDANDPFSVHFPSDFNRNQPLRIQDTKKRKKWSKSHRVSRHRKKNISSISSQTQTQIQTHDDMSIRGSELLDELFPQPKKKKRKTHKKDPFHIDIPIMASTFTLKMENTQKTGIKPHKNKHNLSNININKPYVPLCKQLHSLTCTDRPVTENISTPIQNTNELSIFSKLPHSNTRISNHNITKEDIEETRTTNQDLQYLQTPQRFKYKTRSNNQNDITPQSLKRVSKMKTPKKKRSDKEEIDHSSEDEPEPINERSDTPKWLNKLTNKAIESNKKKRDNCVGILSTDSGKKKHNCSGKWQRDLRDLTLKIANRYNMVTMYADCIHKIPVSLGVTEKLILKILRIRRVSYYDLYQTVCVYYDGNIFVYVLCYFEARKFEELELEKYDFVTIYRPWNDMSYYGMDKCGNKKCDIRVMAAIDNVIKISNPRQCVNEYGKYPKYDIKVFKQFILAQQHTLEGIGGNKVFEMKVADGDGDGDSVMNDMDVFDNKSVFDEDESFWLQNIDAIIESERLRMNSGCVSINEIAEYEMFDDTKKRYNLRAMIQRIYIKNGGNKDDMMENDVELLVSDESGHCGMIVMKLRDLLQNAFDSDFNDSLGDQLKHLMQLESIWFEFNNLSICNKNDGDYNQEIQSLLIQFQYLYLDGNGINPKVNIKKIERESSDICCNGLELNKGTLLTDGKMYYHFEHFNNIPSSHNNQIQINKKYFKRLELRYFECKSLQKSSQQQQQSNVLYEESLIIELNEICLYLDKYWKTKRASTRISVCVRIIAKSFIFENVIYICDNSLLSPLDPTANIQCIPLIIDNMHLFQSICKVNEMDNEYLYKNQPLIVLRDIAMYFTNNINSEGNNGDLQLRFDSFSMIDDIKGMGIIAEHRECAYKYHLFGAEQNIFDINALCQTPWIALNSSMIKINGNVELMAINDGFDVRCEECRKISLQSYQLNNENENNNNVILDDNDDENKRVEGVACIECLKKKGEIRMILKRGTDDFVVIVVPVINIWYKTSDLDKYSQGIVQVIDWKDHKTYLDELNTLKINLCNLVNKGNDKLKQCVIEYESTTNNSDSIENVNCYNCFHCVI